MNKKLLIPDIGDFESVEVIEILVKQGDKISINDPVITIESDKSSVEVPSIFKGTIDSFTQYKQNKPTFMEQNYGYPPVEGATLKIENK